MNDKNEQPADETNRFLKFNYPEIRDLIKYGLTVMIGVRTFSVTFGEKIVTGTVAWAKHLYSFALVAFFVGLILSGWALYQNYMAGEKANGWVIYESKFDFKIHGQGSYNLITFGVFAYILGILCLSVVAISRTF